MELVERIKKKDNLMSFLKQDANNFVTKENCWNFVTIMLRTNDYVLFHEITLCSCMSV